MKVEILIIDGKGPFHLLIHGGTVVMLGIIAQSKGTFKPSFVQAGAIRIHTFNQIPGASGLL